jgi:hypothetical protein
MISGGIRVGIFQNVGIGETFVSEDNVISRGLGSEALKLVVFSAVLQGYCYCSSQVFNASLVYDVFLMGFQLSCGRVVVDRGGGISKSSDSPHEYLKGTAGLRK